MQNNDKLILVGLITSCSGIKGHVVVKSFMQNNEDIFNTSLITSELVNINLSLVYKKVNGTFVCRLNTLSNRSEAETWLKEKLFCYRSSLPAISDSEFYIDDLRNLKLKNLKGDEIGFINNVYDFGAGTIIEIKFISGKIASVPFSQKFFPLICFEYGVCTANEKQC